MELRRSRFSLSARLLALAALAMLPALALLIYDDLTLRRDQDVEARAVTREQVTLAAAEARQIVEGVRHLLVTLSRLPVVRTQDDARCTASLGDVERQFVAYAVVAATDAGGQIFCASRPIAAPGPSVGDTDYFRSAAEGRRFTVGGYAIDRVTGTPVMHFAYPYLDAQGDFAGVVYAALSLDWLARHFRETPWVPGSSLTLADRDGTVLISLPDRERMGSAIPVPLRGLLKAASLGTTNALPGWLTAYSPIVPGRDEIFAAVEMPQAQALAEAKRTTQHGALIILASLLLALAVAAVAGRYFIERPVEKLLRAAAKLSLGDYSARTELTRSAPEFRCLAEAFDHMAAVIQRREQELKEATRAKSQLLAAAGHDLKQPLQVLSMAVDRLAQGDGSPEALRHLARADRAIQRLARALDNLLQASRIESGALRPEKQVLVVGDVLREIDEAFSPLAREKGLRFSMVRSSALIESDPHLLWEVLHNLVGNAIKYTERGRILVGCRRRCDTLSIQVIDTGPGIPKHEQAAVFEEFHRLHHGSGSGMGLGLAIVKRIAGVLDHGIELRSALGKGSCFAVTIPLAAKRDESAGLPPCLETAWSTPPSVLDGIERDALSRPSRLL